MQTAEDFGLDPLDTSFFQFPTTLFYHVNEDSIDQKNQQVLANLYNNIENGLEIAVKTSNFSNDTLDSFNSAAYILRNIQPR